ncbi:hypothetical protein [Streptomyces sp. NPDC053431]|uniref:hypothetical protein n=1 Tax=Streptomyces sp. NPDC053431 TaxID=3365703 RepID=UPI0037CEFE10
MKNIARVLLTACLGLVVAFSTSSAAQASPSAWFRQCSLQWKTLSPTLKIRSCVQQGKEYFADYDRALVEVNNTGGDLWLANIDAKLFQKSGSWYQIKDTTHWNYGWVPGGTTTTFYGNWVNDAAFDFYVEFGRASATYGLYQWTYIAADSPDVS